MNEEKDPIERQQSEGIQAQASGGNARPSLGPRLLAILLLICVAPFLVFTGYGGMTAGETIGAILFFLFGIGALITVMGLRALWMAKASHYEGWAVALIVLALVLVGLYMWLSTWIFEPIAL
jgi:hypothetical protein